MLFLYILFLLSTFAYGFVTERPFQVVRNMMKLEKVPTDIEDFNALNDLQGQDESIAYGRIINDNSDSIQIQKKLDFKPKYDPGWKFIGLGKRPRQKEIGYGYANPYNEVIPNDSDFLNDDYQDGRIHPLLTFSSLVNFEILNAIRDGIAEAAMDIKKGENMKSPQLFAGVKTSNNQFSGRSMYSGRQSGMYDPGWMLTGLGK